MALAERSIIMLNCGHIMSTLAYLTVRDHRVGMISILALTNISQRYAMLRHIVNWPLPTNKF